MGQALRNIGIVSGLTLFSRVLGLGREMAIAAAFGATALGSAFVTAFTLPNLFRRMLGEGALTSALVPTLQEETRREGDAGALRLVSEVATWTFIVSGAITALAMGLFGAHGWWGPRLGGLGLEADTVGRWVLGARLATVLFPYLVMVCLAAVFSAALQTRGRFLEPALNPVWLNVSMVGLLAAGAWLGGPDDAEARMRGLCAGVLAGGFLQMAVPAWALTRLGWKPRWAPTLGPGVRQIARLMAPALFGSAIYLINMTVSRLFALSINDGAATVLNFSTRVMELPIGVFAIAVATVVFPAIARHVAEGRMDRLAADYRHGMRLILLVNVPAAAGLLVLAEPITRVLFQRGEFTAEDTAAMAPVLAASALALPLVAYVSLTLRVFYARKDMRTPVRAAGWSFVVNVAASVVLMRWFGVVGLALASTLAAATQAAYLQAKLAGEEDGLRFRHLGAHLVKVVVASVVMAGLVALVWWAWRGGAGDGGSSWVELAGLAAAVAAGVAVYAACAWMLRIEGREELVALVRRKLRR
jgi:putative peptidoglycan lipid II flippase